MYQEKVARGTSGWLMLFALMALEIVAVWQIIEGARTEAVWPLVLWVVVLAGAGFCFSGLTVVNPNDARVVMLYGKYKGSLKEAGFWWVNPLTTRRKVTLRIRNFESSKLKVNDHDGNPIEIAAVVVWRVAETAEAMFNVDEYEQFVHVQSEAAVRNLATSYPYDAHEPG